MHAVYDVGPAALPAGPVIGQDLADWYRLRAAIVGRLSAFCGITSPDDVATDWAAVCDLLSADSDELADAMARHGITPAMFAEQLGAMVQSAPEGGYLAPDPIPSRVGSRTFKRADGTVRGRADAPVIGHNDNGEYVRMFGPDLVALADLYFHASGEPLPLIGTDSYSWAEVVTHRPDRYILADGTPFILAPEGAGASITGQGRKRRPHKGTTVTRHRVPDVVEYVDAWPMGNVRVIKRYAITSPGLGRMIGHGSWIKPATRQGGHKARTAARLARRPKIQPTSVALVLQQCDQFTADTYGSGTDRKVIAATTTGTRVAITHEVDRRRWRVTVTTADGARMTTAVRTRDAVSRYVAHHVK